MSVADYLLPPVRYASRLLAVTAVSLMLTSCGVAESRVDDLERRLRRQEDGLARIESSVAAIGSNLAHLTGVTQRLAEEAQRNTRNGATMVERLGASERTIAGWLVLHGSEQAAQRRRLEELASAHDAYTRTVAGTYATQSSVAAVSSRMDLVSQGVANLGAGRRLPVVMNPAQKDALLNYVVAYHREHPTVADLPDLPMALSTGLVTYEEVIGGLRARLAASPQEARGVAGIVYAHQLGGVVVRRERELTGVNDLRERITIRRRYALQAGELGERLYGGATPLLDAEQRARIEQRALN